MRTFAERVATLEGTIGRLKDKGRSQNQALHALAKKYNMDYKLINECYQDHRKAGDFEWLNFQLSQYRYRLLWDEPYLRLGVLGKWLWSKATH